MNEIWLPGPIEDVIILIFIFHLFIWIYLLNNYLNKRKEEKKI